MYFWLPFIIKCTFCVRVTWITVVYTCMRVKKSKVLRSVLISAYNFVPCPFIDISNKSLWLMLTTALVKRSHSIPINIGTYSSRLKVANSTCILVYPCIGSEKEIPSAGWKINALIKKKLGCLLCCTSVALLTCRSKQLLKWSLHCCQMRFVVNKSTRAIACTTFNNTCMTQGSISIFYI